MPEYQRIHLPESQEERRAILKQHIGKQVRISDMYFYTEDNPHLEEGKLLGLGDESGEKIYKLETLLTFRTETFRVKNLKILEVLI